jgi:SWI/SNF-related matrix-associated actin-dependent regulator 1 of chromatin subfamily A
MAPSLPLRDYQVKFCDAFMRGHTAYGALDAGLGKSLCGIEIAKRLKAKRILVLCPASVKLAWITEIKKWSPASKFYSPITIRDIGAFSVNEGVPLWTLVNFDKLSRSDTFAQALADQGPYDLLVIDEAHYLKNLTAKRTRAAFKILAPVTKKILPLSGTPMTATAGDLYVPLRFLKPETISNTQGRVMTLFEFQDQYCQIEMKRIGPKIVREVRGSRRMDELSKRMNGFFFRVRKEDVLKELPPMQIETINIGLQAADYDMINREIGEINFNLDDEDLLSDLSKKEHIMRAMKMIGVAKTRPAAQYIKEYLTDTDLKVIIWAKHHDVIDALYADLKEFNPVGIDGRMSMKVREQNLNAFLTDPAHQIFIGQVQSASTGITILNETVKPRDVFAIESDWSPSNNYQAYSRVHRIGANPEGVLVRVFTAYGIELDAKLQKILARKAQEFTTLIDGDKK